MASEYWLISTRNAGEPTPGDDTETRKSISKLSKDLDDCAQVNRFELPELRVGTLDKLMNAGDTLQKVDLVVESAIRKIERQFGELNVNNELLSVDGKPTLQYLENFHWNAAKYPTQRAVDELIKSIRVSVAKMEQELKDSSAYCAEKKSSVQVLERQKGGNLMVANLNDVLTSKINPSMIHDSPYLRTCVIIVPKALNKEFLASYAAIGDTLVGYGPETDRDQVKGSPVVPESATLISTDNDGYSAYLITILKKFYEEFKVASQSARFLVRDYDFRAAEKALRYIEEEGDGMSALDVSKREYEEASMNLRNWCKTHYGDAFMAWIHIKAIRVFVESVLRYGLPVNFAAALVLPKKKNSDKRVREKLARLFADLDNSGMMQMSVDEGLAGEEIYPYVSYKIMPMAGEGH